MLKAQVTADQDFNINLKFASSPEEVLKGSKPMLNELLRGMSLEFKLAFWKGYSKVLQKMAQLEEVPEEMKMNLNMLSFVSGLTINSEI